MYLLIFEKVELFKILNLWNNAEKNWNVSQIRH